MADDKIKNLFSPTAWVESFVAKMILNKGVKHAVTAMIGLLGSAVFITKVQPVLTKLGISIDPVQLAAGLTAFFAAGAGWLINWAQRAMHIQEAPGSTALSTPPAGAKV